MEQRIIDLIALLEKEGLELPRDFAKKLLQFEAELLETNQVMNLTAITDPDEMMKKHYWDSIFPASKELFPQGAKVVDVG
ncbi:MAG: class I SAM-dependent methyltransferase, partial [Clostridia bacterium]|nr:class I SAM-dependent methyltransferase [Clostridia bacterium]